MGMVALVSSCFTISVIQMHPNVNNMNQQEMSVGRNTTRFHPEKEILVYINMKQYGSKQEQTKFIYIYMIINI